MSNWSFWRGQTTAHEVFYSFGIIGMLSIPNAKDAVSGSHLMNFASSKWSLRLFQQTLLGLFRSFRKRLSMLCNMLPQRGRTRLHLRMYGTWLERRLSAQEYRLMLETFSSHLFRDTLLRYGSLLFPAEAFELCLETFC